MASHSTYAAEGVLFSWLLVPGPSDIDATTGAKIGEVRRQTCREGSWYDTEPRFWAMFTSIHGVQVERQLREEATAQGGGGPTNILAPRSVRLDISACTHANQLQEQIFSGSSR